MGVRLHQNESPRLVRSASAARILRSGVFCLTLMASALRADRQPSAAEEQPSAAMMTPVRGRDYGGNPIRRTISANVGLRRMGSNTGSTFRLTSTGLSAAERILETFERSPVVVQADPYDRQKPGWAVGMSLFQPLHFLFGFPGAPRAAEHVNE